MLTGRLLGSYNQKYPSVFSLNELVDAARLVLESLENIAIPDSGVLFVEVTTARERAVAALAHIMQIVEDSNKDNLRQYPCRHTLRMLSLCSTISPLKGNNRFVSISSAKARAAGNICEIDSSESFHRLHKLHRPCHKLEKFPQSTHRRSGHRRQRGPLSLPTSSLILSRTVMVLLSFSISKICFVYRCATRLDAYRNRTLASFRVAVTIILLTSHYYGQCTPSERLRRKSRQSSY